MNEDKAKELLYPDNKEMNDHDHSVQDKQQKTPNLGICAVKQGNKMQTKGTGNIQYNPGRLFSKTRKRNGIQTLTHLEP